MEKIIDTVNKKAVEDMKEESPYTAFKSEKNLERAEDLEVKGRKGPEFPRFPSYHRKPGTSRKEAYSAGSPGRSRAEGKDLS